MRHAGKIGVNRFATDIFAQCQTQALVGFFETFRCQKLAKINGFTTQIGQFNADGIAARNDSHAR